MKVRKGFVSNSSSCSFIIYNLTNKDLHISEFVRENQNLILEFEKEYFTFDEEHKVIFKKMLEEAKNNYDYYIPANGSQLCEFGDEHGTYIGNIYDYILRGGGESDSFKWRFYEMLR